MLELRGVFTAMATPFRDDGAFDPAAAQRLARHLIDSSSSFSASLSVGDSPVEPASTRP